MAQQTHVEVGSAAVDLTAGLPPGCYAAQCRAPAVGEFRAVLYATAAVPPSDDGDWFVARGGQFFTFTAGRGLPTWAKNASVDPADPVILAIASYDA